MFVSAAHLYGFQAFVRVRGVGGVAHAHRNRGIRFGVVAELTMLVDAPGVYVSVATHGQRMPFSCAHLHIGEVGRHACRFSHYVRRTPAVSRCVAELTIGVVSPCVGFPVAAHGQGKNIGIVFCSADLVESDAAGAVWRGDGGGFVAELAAFVWVDSPGGVGGFAGPFGGEGEVFGDGLAEVVGDFVDKPSVELVAAAGRVG